MPLTREVIDGGTQGAARWTGEGTRRLASDLDDPLLGTNFTKLGRLNAEYLNTHNSGPDDLFEEALTVETSTAPGTLGTQYLAIDGGTAKAATSRGNGQYFKQQVINQLSQGEFGIYLRQSVASEDMEDIAYHGPEDQLGSGVAVVMRLESVPAEWIVEAQPTVVWEATLTQPTGIGAWRVQAQPEPSWDGTMVLAGQQTQAVTWEVRARPEPHWLTRVATSTDCMTSDGVIGEPLEYYDEVPGGGEQYVQPNLLYHH